MCRKANLNVIFEMSNGYSCMPVVAFLDLKISSIEGLYPGCDILTILSRKLNQRENKTWRNKTTN